MKMKMITLKDMKMITFPPQFELKDMIMKMMPERYEDEDEDDSLE